MSSGLPLEPSPTSRFRWWIVVLLFFATTINYVDRALFSNLIPFFEAELRVGPMDLAYINVAFALTYGLGMLFVGRFVDRVGVRVGLALTFLIWNLASIGHALVFSVAAFVVVRILLGVGEAGNFPSSIKAVAEWFPKRERALATGWFNCGSNVGAVITPLLVPVIAGACGWRACFAVLGGVGIVWLAFWLPLYRRPEESSRVSAGELALILSDPPDAVEKVPLLTLLGQRQMYGYALARFFTEAPWWFYLFWMPKFLADRGLSDTARGWALAAIYIVADVGAIGGGWISSAMIRHGLSVNRARKVGLLIAALCTVPTLAIAYFESERMTGNTVIWIAVGLVALAAAGHQAWSSNLYTITSDTLPKGAVATAIGVGMAFGSVGTAVFQVATALFLVKTGAYVLPFLFAGTLYLVGLGVLHVLMPRLEPAKIDASTRPRVRPWQFAAAGIALGCTLIFLQLYYNQPPYSSMPAYFDKRRTQLSAISWQEGPAARVGWQEARWVYWTLQDGSQKWELVKLDRDGRPVLEPRGLEAKNYSGPTREKLAEPMP